MVVSVKKNTLNRLRKYCYAGEKHDNFINRLINVCIEEEKYINVSDATLEKLQIFTDCDDVDEALNILLDKYKNVIK